jgi:hypothetical protein
MVEKFSSIIDDLCLGIDIDDVDDVFSNEDWIESYRYCDEKIDDGVTEDNSEDEYVMLRSYEVKCRMPNEDIGICLCVYFYFGNNTKTITYIAYA